MPPQKLISILSLTFLSLLLLTQNWTKPFIGHHDFNSNLWTLTARNNIYRGLFCTKLGQATTFQSQSDCPQPLTYYQNHPPLISWLVTLSYSIFGFAEWAGRLPLILVSTGSILLIYLITTRLSNPFTGLLASFITLTTPMFLYFGKAINHEPLVLFGILLATWAYINWTASPPHSKRHILYSVFYILSSIWIGLSGWHGYLIFPLFCLHSLTSQLKFYPTDLSPAEATGFRNGGIRSLRKSVSRRWAAPLLSLIPIIVLVSIFFIHQYHTCIIGDCTTSLFQKFLERTHIAQEGQIITFTLPQFLYKEFSYTKAYYSPYLLLFSIFYFLFSIFDYTHQKKVRLNHQILLLLGTFGFSIPLIFSQQAFIHDYLLIYLLPFISISAAIVATPIIKLAAKPLSRRLKTKQVFTRYLLLPLIPIFIYWQSSSFITALQQSDHARPHYQLANLINAISSQNPNTNILLESTNYYNFAHPYLTNYSYGTSHASRTDTLVSFFADQKSLEKTHTHIITVSTHPIEQPLISLLDQLYPHHTHGPHTVYTLTQ